MGETKVKTEKPGSMHVKLNTIDNEMNFNDFNLLVT